MTKSTRKVIEKTLKHYDDMIEWAKGQKQRGYVDDWKMLFEIGQNWYGDHCPLCKEFSPLLTTCGKCPLYARYGGCGRNEWNKMDNAGTWKTWIRHATLMREQIESLLKEVKKDAE